MMQQTVQRHARAFLKENQFYIMDESTSNLDFATENIIFDMIYKNGRENEHLSALRDTLLPKLMAGNFSRKCCN